MALETPTTKEINDLLIAQMEASLNQNIPLLARAFLRVLMKVVAAVFTLLYKYGGFIFLQVFVKTATIKETTINGVVLRPLVEWGRLNGTGDPTDATRAELLVNVTVNNQTGQLDSGSQLVGNINGVTYITLGAVLLDAPTVQVTVRAVADQAGGGGAGAIGNLDPGAGITFANPLANIERAALVDSQVVTGANGEATEVYRQRVLDRFQKIPQGGAYADYELWGEEVPGIINIYPYTSDCPGQVDVYAEATEASSGSPDGFPTDAQLEAVLDSIFLDLNGLNTRRPANALVNAFSIARRSFSTVVKGLSVDNLAQVQSDITDGVDQYFLEREPFIEGTSIPPRLDRVTRSAVGGLVEDIVSAAGGIFSTALVSTLELFLPTTTFTTDFDLSPQEVEPKGSSWSDDGLQLFIVGTSGFVFEYAVATPYDLSSPPVYSGNSFDVSNEDSKPRAIRFNENGTKFFILGVTNRTVYEYTVSIGFDLSSTVAYSGASFLVSAQETDPTGIDWSRDGKKFFIVGNGAIVFEYSLTVGFSLASTVSYTGNSFDTSTQESSPEAIRFANNGDLMYILGPTNVFEYLMSSPFSTGNTVTYSDSTFDVSNEDALPQDVDFDPLRANMYIVGDTNDKVYEYAVGLAEVPIDVFTLGIGEKSKSIGTTFEA